jgi:hypothetical protein
MLEFDKKPMRCLNVGDVFLAVRAIVDHLLPISWEAVLPAQMPFGFWFPPRITSASASMCPMPDSHRPAFGNHWLSAKGTGPLQVHTSYWESALDQSSLHACTPYLDVRTSMRHALSVIVREEFTGPGRPDLRLVPVLPFLQRYPDKLWRWLCMAVSTTLGSAPAMRLSMHCDTPASTRASRIRRRAF